MGIERIENQGPNTLLSTLRGLLGKAERPGSLTLRLLSLPRPESGPCSRICERLRREAKSGS